jgi:hypothetical protein
MATSWSGKLFVLFGTDGNYRVGITAPVGVTDASKVAVYEGTGPFPPTGFPEPIVVPDLQAWLIDQHKRGFRFSPVNNVQSQQPQPAGSVIDPQRSYSRKEVADLLGITETQVQKLWDNWDAQSAPRMNYTKQTGRGPARVSTGAHIQQYLNSYGSKP